MNFIYRKRKISEFFLALLVKFIIIQCGSIYPSGKFPIYNSIANVDEISTYNFTFTVDTIIQKGGTLQITFPSQFSKGLQPYGTIITSQTCSHQCTITNDYIVTFTFSDIIYNQTEYMIFINDIKNPAAPGGTGNFIMKTFDGQNLLDENYIFGSIGIAQYIYTLTDVYISIVSAGLANAGEFTTYSIKFKNQNVIQFNSFIQIDIPLQSGYIIEQFPTCLAFEINNYIIPGVLRCEHVGNGKVIITGLQEEIPKSNELGIYLSMRNPPKSGLTNDFQITIFKQNTTVVREWKKNIPGVNILPGLIKNISLSKVNFYMRQAKLKVMDYELRFILTNGLKTGNVIKIEFPPTFLIEDQCPRPNPLLPPYQESYIKYGLEDIDEFISAGLCSNTNSANNYIYISNFKDFNDHQEISIIVRARNPNQENATTPIKIRTYQDWQMLATDLIDEDVVQAKTSIENVQGTASATTLAGITAIGLTTNLADESIVDLQFKVDPQTMFPANGFIKVRVPDQIAIDPTIINTDCEVNLIPVSSVNCIVSGKIITITHVAVNWAISDPNAYFYIKNVLTKPPYNQTLLFEIELYDTDGQRILQSTTDYFTLQPNAIASTCDIILNQQNQYGIYDISFTSIHPIPSGQKLEKSSDEQGIIQLEFGTIFGNYANDLGLGILDKEYTVCYGISGIIPIDNEDLKCQLFFGSATQFPKIQIKNFQEIPSATPIRIQIPKILNPAAGVYNLLLKIISQKNRIWTILNQQTITVTTKNIASNIATPIIPASGFSSNKVDTKFDITIQPQFSGAAVPTDSYVLIQLPTYDIGFIVKGILISCEINYGTGFIPAPCLAYHTIDWILIQTSNSLTIPTSVATDQIKIANLKWPRYIDSPSSFRIFSIDSTAGVSFGNLQHSSGSFSIQPPIEKGFFLSQITASKKGLNFVNCQYKFEFLSQSLIPEGSEIKINFPSGYNLLSSSPLPQTTFDNLDDISSSQVVTASYLMSELTVINFKQPSLSKSFIITIQGLKNPQTGTVSNGWNVFIYFNTKLVNKQLNFDSFPYDIPYVPQKIIFNIIQARPLNADTLADYNISFTPSTSIPAGGEIKITFPFQQYKDLPSPPQCRLSGAINSFSSCTLQISTYTIKTNIVYNVGNQIYVAIKEILNPDLLTTDGFIIETYFDNQQLDYTDLSQLKGRTVTTLPKANQFFVESITFSPINEGEESSYQFSFRPEEKIETDQYIVIQFPSDYDPKIGRLIKCINIEGLVGSISCFTKNRGIYIYNFETYLPSDIKSIVINILGVINPNRKSDGSPTGWFQLGTNLQNTDEFIAFNEQVKQLEIISAPGWAELFNITYSHLKTRLISDYSIHFQITNTLPKTSQEGFVFVDFPNQFEIQDQSLQCDTPTSEFSTIIVCNITRNRAFINGHTLNYEGEIKINLRGILNPIEQGMSDNIFVRTFDGLNKKIIQRSYRNLDPASFYYFYPGPLIIINDNNPINVPKGMQSKNIYAKVEQPSILNLTLKPITTGFSSIPYVIDLPVGAVQSLFRITVPSHLFEGSYLMTWETLNDDIPPSYTPIKATIVNVVNEIRQIFIDELLDIPFYGHSLKIRFYVDNAPDIGFQIKLNFIALYRGMNMSTQILDFSAGINELYLILNHSQQDYGYSEDTNTGTIEMSIQGVNKDLFFLQKTTLKFKIIAKDQITPEFISFNITNVIKTQATLQIQVSEPCHAYFMVALKGTIFPSFKEVKNGIGAPLNTTQNQYGLIIAKNSSLYETQVNNLIAQTEYTVFFYLEDRGYNLDGKNYSIDFKTSDRYSACDFSLKFNKKLLSQTDIKLIINSVSFILGLQQNKIQQRKYIPQKRQLQQDMVNSIVDLQIIAVPELEYFPSPIQLVEVLISKKSQLVARIPNFDNSYEIPYSEVSRVIPNFVGQPRIVKISHNYVIIQGKLDNYGFIFAICQKRNQEQTISLQTNTSNAENQLIIVGIFDASNPNKSTSSSKMIPSPQQIMWGYDYQNNYTQFGSIEISEKYEDFYFNINHLQSSTNYTVFIIGGSAHPGYPDLMDSNQLVQIDFQTSYDVPQYWLNIEPLPWPLLCYNLQKYSILFIIFIIFTNQLN